VTPASLAAGRWKPSPFPYGLSLRLRLLLIGLATLTVLILSLSGSVLLLTALVFGPAICLLIWHRPFASIFLLAVLGPIHEFLMLLIFRVVGATALLKAAQLWKELIVIVLVVKGLDLALHRRKAPTLHLIDLGIVVFFLYGAVYLFSPLIVPDNTLINRVYGLRADAFFLLAYFVGRGIPLTSPQVRRILSAFIAMAVLIAFVAALQFAFPGPSNAAFNELGLNAFLVSERGNEAATQLVNYREDVGAVLLPRAASLVLSTLALAFYTLLAAPLAVGLFSTLLRGRNPVVFNFVALVAVGTTLMTVTRSAIIAMAPALTVLALRSGRYVRLLLFAVEAAAIVLVVGLALGVTPHLITQIFSLSEGSAVSHQHALADSITILKADPFGRGLGTAGGTGQLFVGANNITSEDWYLQIATEIGIIPAVIFALILIGFGLMAVVQYGRLHDPWLKGLCLGMIGAAAGFFVEGFGLHAWEAQPISIVFWLFAGLVVQGRAIEAASEGG
jgi:hypothetical protein